MTDHAGVFCTEKETRRKSIVATCRRKQRKPNAADALPEDRFLSTERTAASFPFSPQHSLPGKAACSRYKVSMEYKQHPFYKKTIVNYHFRLYFNTGTENIFLIRCNKTSLSRINLMKGAKRC